jgi:hypothetical protein
VIGLRFQAVVKAWGVVEESGLVFAPHATRSSADYYNW